MSPDAVLHTHRRAGFVGRGGARPVRRPARGVVHQRHLLDQVGRASPGRSRSSRSRSLAINTGEYRGMASNCAGISVPGVAVLRGAPRLDPVATAGSTQRTAGRTSRARGSPSSGSATTPISSTSQLASYSDIVPRHLGPGLRPVRRSRTRVRPLTESPAESQAPSCLNVHECRLP